MSVSFGIRDGRMSFVRESLRTDKKSRQLGLWCWPEVKRVRSHSSMSWLRRFCGETQEVFIHTIEIHLKVWEGAGVSASIWKPAWLQTLHVGNLRSVKWESVPAWYLHCHEQWSWWGSLQWLHESQKLPSSCLSNRKAMMDAIWWLHAMPWNN